MGKYKRRSVTCVEKDRISNLPAHLIDSILEWLPVEDAVKTSIISKRWRYGWTTMKELVFDEHFSQKVAKNGAFGPNGFIRIINQVLLLHKGPILKFHLHIPNIFLDSFQEVDQWMLFLSRNGVRKLILSNFNQLYALPSHVFSCLELTMLELENCFFKPPREFERFLNLKELTLKDIGFGDNLSGTHFTLPQLKELSMYSCTNVYNFNIKATKLQTLLVFACPDAMNLVRVNLPRIEVCSIDGNFLKFLFAENIPKWLPHPLNSLKYLLFPYFQLGDFDQVHDALCLLRNSPNLEILSMIDLEMTPQVDLGPASKLLESPNCLGCTLNQLQIVVITSLEGSRPELLFIKLLLARSPSLETLTITPSETCDAKNILNIAKDVMRFPRASPKAEIIYLDPKP